MISLSSRPASSIKLVAGQPGLYQEILSRKQSKQTKLLCNEQKTLAFSHLKPNRVTWLARPQAAQGILVPNITCVLSASQEQQTDPDVLTQACHDWALFTSSQRSLRSPRNTCDGRICTGDPDRLQDLWKK